MIKKFSMQVIGSDEVYRFLSAAPIFILLGLFLLYSTHVNTIPEKSELIPVVGYITQLKNSSGLIEFEGNTENIRFPCICDYGWGYKSFEGSAAIEALVRRNSKNQLYAWELIINDHRIFSYDDLYEKRMSEKEQDVQLAIYLLIGSIAGLILYLVFGYVRRRFPKKNDEIEITQ